MKPKTPIYFCNECKATISSLEDLLFVEDGIPRGFCSEKCIEKFFTPMVKHYEEWERNLRKTLAVEDSPSVLEKISDVKLLDEVLNRPDEIWVLRNYLKEEIYSFISHHNVDGMEFSFICLCLVFNRQASFIILLNITSDAKLLEQMRFGEKIEDPKTFLQSGAVLDPGSNIVGVDEETVKRLEHKKSFLLADMLEKRATGDVPLESFHLYEDFLVNTLERPDEIFSFVDQEGDTLYTYIKAHDQEGISFFYISICIPYQNEGEAADETLLPIISFPTLDGKFCQSYRHGQQLSGNIKN